MKGPEPRELEAIRSTPGASWESSGAETRGPVRTALQRDQGGLCAYCEKRPAGGAFSIEHWHARAADGPDFAWANLLGVRDGNRGRGALHCDAARGDGRLFLHPVDGRGPDPRTHLRWLGNGSVASEHPSARDDIETLRLNHPSLVRQRVQLLEALREAARRGGKQEIRRMLHDLEDLGNDWPAFLETRRYWLTRAASRL